MRQLLTVILTAIVLPIKIHLIGTTIFNKKHETTKAKHQLNLFACKHSAIGQNNTDTSVCISGQTIIKIKTK